MKPLAVDLCCGLGGWSEGLIAEGWDVVGFDVERHEYGSHKYPAQLVLQDIRTLNGRQFLGKVSLIVASPPCQKYSYMAMPWTRAKQLAQWYRDEAHPERIVELNALFDACFRIAREAECPVVVENVRGAVAWVGRARATFGSFYLWGDVPALMPIVRRVAKVGGISFSGYGQPGYVGVAFNGTAAARLKATKNNGGSWFAVAHNTTSGHGQNPDGREVKGSNGGRFNDNKRAGRDDSPGYLSRSGSKGSARKAASAHIAKIPYPLARWIARAWKPTDGAFEVNA